MSLSNDTGIIKVWFSSNLPSWLKRSHVKDDHLFKNLSRSASHHVSEESASAGDTVQSGMMQSILAPSKYRS